MTDPGLRDRLARIEIPTLVVWGAADQIVDLAYGQAYADAIPDIQLTILPDAGHLPQIEIPETLVRMVWQFADAHVADVGSRSLCRESLANSTYRRSRAMGL